MGCGGDIVRGSNAVRVASQAMIINLCKVGLKFSFGPMSGFDNREGDKNFQNLLKL